MLTFDPIKHEFELICDNCGNKYRPKMLMPTDTQALRMAQKKGWGITSNSSGVHHFCPDCLEFSKAEE